MATGSEGTAFSSRAERAWRSMLPVPFCFMGMGIFRVWTETLYGNNQVSFPALQVPFDVPVVRIDGFFFFDITMVLVLTLLAVLARHIAPLYRHPWAIVTTVVSMVGGACVNFASLLLPEMAPVLFWPSVVLGAVGVSLILMLWSEFFGCINPLRIALYYSASIAVSCVILWVFKGLSFWWLWVGTCLVPIVSLLCLWRAYATLPHDAYPPAYQGDFSFPWKPVAVIGAYSVAYGLRGGVFSSALGMHSGVGAFLGALCVYALICRQVLRGTEATRASSGVNPAAAGAPVDDSSQPASTSAFDFSLLYKIGMPLMFVSLVPLDAVFPWWAPVADTCALASYTILLVLIMAILGNLSYRYGVCALWIFAIERAVRLVGSQTGRVVGGVVQPLEENPLVMLAVILVMAALLIFVVVLFFSERSVSSSQWGVVLKPTEQDGAGFEQNRLGVKCRDLANQMGLTSREEEILLLTAQRKTATQMASELYISTNTVKTHMKHLYQKLDVHSREEILELLGVRP